jgi:Protein of unknown function (DUF3592)
MDLLNRLRFYLRYDGRLHATILGALVLVGMLAGFLNHRQNQNMAYMAAVRKWPVVEAEVVRSQVREINTSGKYSFSTDIYANVTFSYVRGGVRKEAVYREKWGRSGYRDWHELLKPGQRLPIRVSPEDSTKASLIDYNGWP